MSTIKGFAVVEHDDAGIIHQVIVFPPEEKTQAYDKGRELIVEYFNEEAKNAEDEVDENEKYEATLEFKKHGTWVGYDHSVTIIETV